MTSAASEPNLQLEAGNEDGQNPAVQIKMLTETVLNLTRRFNLFKQEGEVNK